MVPLVALVLLIPQDPILDALSYLESLTPGPAAAQDAKATDAFHALIRAIEKPTPTLEARLGALLAKNHQEATASPSHPLKASDPLRRILCAYEVERLLNV